MMLATVRSRRGSSSCQASTQSSSPSSGEANSTRSLVSTAAATGAELARESSARPRRLHHAPPKQKIARGVDLVKMVLRKQMRVPPLLRRATQC